MTLRLEGLDRCDRRGTFVIDDAANTAVACGAIGRRDDAFAVLRPGLSVRFGSC